MDMTEIDRLQKRLAEAVAEITRLQDVKPHGPKLGQLIETNEHRDAIHIAVLPVTISDEEPLDPGTPVSFKITGNSEIVCKAAWHRAIGIIDPFLKRKVRIGEMCWMFMMPNTITSLRHEWEHPQVDGVDRKGIAEFWLRDFCAENGLDYDYILSTFTKQDYCNTGDSEISMTMEQRTQLQQHLSVLVGREVDKPRFACAC